MKINVWTADSSAPGLVEDAAHVSGATGTMPLAVRNDAGAALAGTDGDYIPLGTDYLGNQWDSMGTLIEGEDPTNRLLATNNKPVAVSTYTWSVDLPTALEASTVTKATPGVLRSVDGRIDATAPTATYYIHIINATAIPADNTTPTKLWAPKKIQHVNGADSNFSIDCTMNGVYASTGICVYLNLVTSEWVKWIAGAYLSTTILYI